MATIEAPLGRSRSKDNMIPKTTDTTEKNAESAKAILNPLDSCNEETAGMTRRDDTSMMPTALVAITTVTAVNIKSMEFILPAGIPEIFAYSSSIVTATRSWYKIRNIVRITVDKKTVMNNSD